MPGKIIDRNSKEMYIEDMVAYSIIVDRRRAFPEVKDGLKPVQRRVLYTMLKIGAISRTVKSAQIVGKCMGELNPHGDAGIYTAMQVLENWWKTKSPLITGQGNWGTVMGDPCAASRYTEAKISDFAYDCIISDLKEIKYSVDWKDNFDRTLQEPEFLPVKVPILLINGAFGIGVGLATNIPTHNLVDVIEATRALLRNTNADICIVPDHCQPLEIFDTDWKKINDTGYGSYKVRGLVEVSQITSGRDKECPVIKILSLPDNTTTAAVTTKLFELISKKQLPMVKDVLDLSKQTVDIEVVLKKGSDPYYVIETLYNKCGVQGTVSVNFQAVDDINPKRLSYKEYLLDFLEFRATTKFRIYCNKYKDTTTRTHKLETYIKVIESGEIDNIVRMVKKQNTTDDTELQEYLIKKLNITDLQANYILSTDIRKLSRGYLNKYKEEYARLKQDEEVYRAAITDDGSIIMNEIDQELLEIEKKYGTPRLCKVISPVSQSNIPKGTFKVVITERNYVRKIPDTDRVTTIRGDQPKFVLRGENDQNILLFDNKGKVFKLPIYKIPLSDKSSPGTDIRVLSKNCTADIINMTYEPAIKKVVEGQRKHYLVVVTKNNIIKKLDIDDFLNVNLAGLMYSKIRDDDEVVGISICPSNLDVVIYSKQKALRCNIADIPLFKRNASGSKAMTTTSEIEGLSIIYPDTTSIVVLTASGKANKFPIGGLSPHRRGGAGNNVIKLDPTDSIEYIYGACESDIIKVTTTDGIFEINVSDIKSKSGVAAGQKVIPGRPVIIRSDLIYNQK